MQERLPRQAWLGLQAGAPPVVPGVIRVELLRAGPVLKPLLGVPVDRGDAGVAGEGRLAAGPVPWAPDVLGAGRLAVPLFAAGLNQPARRVFAAQKVLDAQLPSIRPAIPAGWRECCKAEACMIFGLGAPLRRPRVEKWNDVGGRWGNVGPEGRVRAYLLAAVPPDDDRCARGKVFIKVEYNTYNPPDPERKREGGCQEHAEREMALVKDKHGNPQEKEPGWVFSGLGSPCSNVAIRYSGPDPTANSPRGRCSTITWSWDCPYRCEEGDPGSSTREPENYPRCASRGRVGIAAYAEGIGLLPETLFVQWEVASKTPGKCDCSCDAKIELAQTNLENTEPWFGPHYDHENNVKAEKDPSDCSDAAQGG